MRHPRVNSRSARSAAAPAGLSEADKKRRIRHITVKINLFMSKVNNLCEELRELNQ